MSWPDVVTAALLGTARRPPPEADGAAVGEPAASPEAELLRQAAVLSLYRRAGERPARVAPAAGVAPDDTLPTCSPAAGAHLAQILGGRHHGALEEWLAALGASGRRLRPEHLPVVLDLGAQADDLAELVEPVLGERGRWLAGRREEWAWARGGDPAERWQTGERGARMHLLLTLRAEDPARGRALLESTWDEEPARERERFVRVLARGLSPADEPFLEAALDGRAQGVRVQAARLLAALPGSALGRRMAARLAPLIDCGRRQLAVALPAAELDDAMLRDGMVARPPSRTGRAAWVLHQLAVAAPLSVWTRGCDRPAAKVVQMKVADRMGDPLAAAWTQGAVLQRDAEWARALLDRGRAAPDQLGPLLGVVPPAEAEAYVAGVMRGRHAAAADTLLDHLPERWSEPFTARAFEHALGLASPRPWLRAAGRSGAPSFAPRAAAALEKLDPATPVARHARDAAALLAFRRDMLSTLTEP